jgi:rhamnulokinase/L-fuculokinase
MMDGLKELTGKNFSALHIFGGGIQAKLLCKMSASACNVRVICGPVEATASGNIALQMIALGKIKDITQAREMLKLSPDIYMVNPENVDEWKEKYSIYKKRIKGE